MSPANIDDSSSPLDAGAGRPLTRKELREREKTLNAGGHDAVPEQAYETGHDIPPLPAEPPAAAEADPRRQDEALREEPAPQDRVEEPLIPAAPATPPSIQDDHHEPALAGHQHAAGAHYRDEPHYEEPGYADGHGYAAGVHQHDGHYDGTHYGDGHDDGTHYEEGHDDGAHHHELLPASAAATVVAKPSKKVRRRR
ncbi:MAG: aminodeoxychorismate lyase, partial [Pseudarthrobacter sp.]